MLVPWRVPWRLPSWKINVVHLKITCFEKGKSSETNHHGFRFYVNLWVVALNPPDDITIIINVEMIPGSSKKTAMARDKLLTFVAPSNPHFKVATEKGWTYLTWMAVFSEGRRRQPERNNFEVGGHGGSHAWIYCSIGWLFFMKNPDWNEGHCQSLPALLLRTLRTLADIRTKNAKYHGSNLNYKLDKKSSEGICAAGAALWDACGSFVWQALGFGSMMAVLRVCCMWVAWQGHATQPSYFRSPAPATQKSSMHPKVLHLPQIPSELFCPICYSDCCHDILHPLS